MKYAKWVHNQENLGYSKVTVVLVISHFRGMLIVIVWRINCSEEKQVIKC